jgi:effector-binding domain-containing protein
MQIKNIQPINFLLYRTETRLSELSQLIPIGQQLFAEAVKLGLFISGPIHWHYYDFIGPEAPFSLEICLPVSRIVEEYDGKFHFKRSESFRCVTATHEGSWQSLPESYQRVMSFISGNKLVANNVSREIYVNVDFNELSANVTEIQVGII